MHVELRGVLLDCSVTLIAIFFHEYTVELHIFFLLRRLALDYACIRVVCDAKTEKVAF